MHLILHTPHVHDRLALEPVVRRRAGFALARFEPMITRMTLRLSDINGPRGGYGIECLGVVEFVHGGSLVVKGLARTAQAALNDVIDRARSAVVRSCDRLKRHR